MLLRGVLLEVLLLLRAVARAAGRRHVVRHPAGGRPHRRGASNREGGASTSHAAHRRVPIGDGYVAMH